MKKKLHYFLAFLIAYSIKICMKLLLRTCRINVVGLEAFLSFARHSPCILMLWHNRIIALGELLELFAPHMTYTAVVSKSRDGDPVAILAKSYPNGQVIRVAHNGRHNALNQMISCLKNKKRVLLITPDGPRGPKYLVKPGIVFAARESAAKIIPFSWKADRSWSLKTWDQLLIPKPFSKIKVVFGSPIFFEKESSVSLESQTEQLREILLAL